MTGRAEATEGAEEKALKAETGARMATPRRVIAVHALMEVTGTLSAFAQLKTQNRTLREFCAARISSPLHAWQTESHALRQRGVRSRLDIFPSDDTLNSSEGQPYDIRVYLFFFSL